MTTIVDLRSDTLTLPRPAMRQAMSAAPLGDDVFGEDPTVNKLEELAAHKVGKEAALFIPTGTMGNVCAILAHCDRGKEVMVGNRSHIFHWEAGGVSVMGGVPMHPLHTQANGEIPVEAIADNIRGDEDSHEAPTRAICLESSHNECGGPVLSLDYLRKIRHIGNSHQLAVHLDGARLFNAALALGVPVTHITDQVDSVMFCLSKGLGAPVGSMVAGTRAKVHEMRRARKMLGGGMRQAGVLAAAGIFALENMIDRLAEDHANARHLAEGIAGIDGFSVDMDLVQTNIVCFQSSAANGRDAVVAEAKKHGLLLSQTKKALRAVAHDGITRTDMDKALEALAKTAAALS